MTSINIHYDRDINKIKYFCQDGYTNGSIESRWGYGWGRRDNFGRHNITIKEWTDYIKAQHGLDWRVPEVNDCTIISKSATPIDNFGDLKERRQTFKVKYRRPFKASGLTDVELQPGLNYNITSYFGCYQRGDPNKDEGTDPNKYDRDGWGCKSTL